MSSFLAGGLRAAFLLAQGRPDGLIRVATGPSAVPRSFAAALICLPLFAALRWMEWKAGARPPHPEHALVVEFLAYVIGWAGFALISRNLLTAMGRPERWGLFVTVWNWSNVAQYSMLLLAAVPDLLGAPPLVAETIGLVALGWALWLEWFVARLTLSVSAAMALLPVLLDLILGIVLSGLSRSLGG